MSTYSHRYKIVRVESRFVEVHGTFIKIWLMQSWSQPEQDPVSRNKTQAQAEFASQAQCSTSLNSDSRNLCLHLISDTSIVTSNASSQNQLFLLNLIWKVSKTHFDRIWVGTRYELRFVTEFVSRNRALESFVFYPTNRDYTCQECIRCIVLNMNNKKTQRTCSIIQLYLTSLKGELKLRVLMHAG